MKIKLNNKKFVVATHIFATGPATDLKEYLLQNKCHQFLFISHPLFFDKNLRGSGYEYYEDGEMINKYDPKIHKIATIPSYLKDFFLNIFWTIRLARNADIYIGSDNLNALSGVVLKKLGVVKKVVYYVIDYNPRRFENALLNKIYHKIDQICVTKCDETWNVSPRMEGARKKYFNFSGGNQKILPLGVWINRIKPLHHSKRDNHTLVYMGHILKKQGIQHVLDAIPSILKRIPDFKFLVIGGGEYLDTLKQKAKTLGISKCVYFTDFVKNHIDIEKMLTKCGAAVALYEKYVDRRLSFTYFSDPGKIKSYLAAGLPVFLTDVPYNARELERMNCGKVITYKQETIARAVSTILKDDVQLEKIQYNAREYALAYDWSIIFSKSLQNLL